MFRIVAAVLAIGIVLGLGAELVHGTSGPLGPTVASTAAPSSSAAN